jgi:anti-sigma regulatory factor (Ser/Thr protein kinase)
MPPNTAEAPAAAGPPAALFSDRRVMNEHFEILPRGGRAEDISRVGVMRRIAAARLRFCGLQDLMDDAALVVTELVTNSIRHSGGSHVQVDMTVHGSYLRIAVTGDRPGHPELQAPLKDSENGRGLLIVSAIARESGGTWGSTDNGTTTWCTLRLPEHPG